MSEKNAIISQSNIELETLVNELSEKQMEIEEANEILQLAEEANRQNKGVAIINGKFIGPPLVVKAKNIIKKKKLIDYRNTQRLNGQYQ